MGAYGRLTVGYIKKVGKGQIVHLGMEPTQDLVLGVLRHLGIPLFACSMTRDVKTAIFTRGSRFYLVAVNNGNEDKSATISLPALEKKTGRLTARDLITGEKVVQSKERRRIFNVALSRKDGRIFEIGVSAR